ncbi:MAG: hypothetical protein D6732_05065 [Methanobacteriota archaeon]|nr:MAG: hypothetical protein D6732_05065 [Euryarchaeota archaeon]
MCSYDEGFPEDIIEEWIQFHHLQMEKNFKVGKGFIGLTYLLPQINVGIVVTKWKRPITISVIHKVMRVKDWLNLDSIILVASKVSHVARETVERSKENVHIVTMDRLSELAIFLSTKAIKRIETCA